MVRTRNGKSLLLFYLTFVSLPSAHISLFLPHLFFFSSLPLFELSFSVTAIPHWSYYIAHKPTPLRLPCRRPHASLSTTQCHPPPMFSNIPHCWPPTFESLNRPLFIVVVMVVFWLLPWIFFFFFGCVDVGWVSWVVMGWCWWVMAVGVGWFWWFGWFWILVMVVGGSGLVGWFWVLVMVVGGGELWWWWWCLIGSGGSGLCSIYYCFLKIFFKNVILMCCIYNLIYEIEE